MLVDELAHTHLDLHMERFALTRRTRVRRERVREVSQAVQHEDRAVPSCGSRSGATASERRVLLLCSVDAHLHRGVDERVQRALDRRTFALPAGTGVVISLGGVQREDGA